jgi:hypothetical protein
VTGMRGAVRTGCDGQAAGISLRLRRAGGGHFVAIATCGPENRYVAAVRPGHNLRAFAFGKGAQNVPGLRILKAGS